MILISMGRPKKPIGGKHNIKQYGATRSARRKHHETAGGLPENVYERLAGIQKAQFVRLSREFEKSQDGRVLMQLGENANERLGRIADALQRQGKTIFDAEDSVKVAFRVSVEAQIRYYRAFADFLKRNRAFKEFAGEFEERIKVQQSLLKKVFPGH